MAETAEIKSETVEWWKMQAERYKAETAKLSTRLDQAVAVYTKDIADAAMRIERLGKTAAELEAQVKAATLRATQAESALGTANADNAVLLDRLANSDAALKALAARYKAEREAMSQEAPADEPPAAQEKPKTAKKGKA